MKNKNKFKELRTSYKIAIVTAVITIICIFLTLASLFSIYDLVGETTIGDTEQTTSADKKLNTIEKRNNVLNGIIVLSSFTSLASAGYGAYQDAKSKAKK